MSDRRMLDRRVAEGQVYARRRTYLSDRSTDACKAGLCVQNVNDFFQCVLLSEARIARFYQVRDEFIGAWNGQTNWYDDYAVSFVECGQGTAIAFSWVEALTHLPLLERQMDAFMLHKLDARPW